MGTGGGWSTDTLQYLRSVRFHERGDRNPSCDGRDRTGQAPSSNSGRAQFSLPARSHNRGRSQRTFWLAERNSGGDHDHDGQTFVVYDASIDPSRKPFPFFTDYRSRRLVPRDICDDGAGLGNPQCSCRSVRFALAVALLLDVRSSIQRSRQCADLSDIFGNGFRISRDQCGKLGFDVTVRAGPNAACRGVLWIRVYGGQYIYRKWTELHGEEYRGGAGHRDAIVRWLHGVFGSDPDSSVHTCDVCLLHRLKGRNPTETQRFSHESTTEEYVRLRDGTRCRPPFVDTSDGQGRPLAFSGAAACTHEGSGADLHGLVLTLPSVVGHGLRPGLRDGSKPATGCIRHA